MIHYTLQGPTFKLEIHEDKMYLKRKVWWKLFSSKKNDNVWFLSGLKEFNMSITQNSFWGKLEWESFDGIKGSFSFSTKPEMVQKIEKYMHKKILKNHEQIKILAAATKVVEQPIKMSSKKAKRKQRREMDLAA